jgi:putative membrane protein insertion efficiency factor
MTSLPARVCGLHEIREVIMKYLGMGLIWVYQRTFSIILPSSCRFTPSCSQYGYTAIERFGLLRGGWMAIKRIGRCHPFYKGSLIDPVPELLQSKPVKS